MLKKHFNEFYYLFHCFIFPFYNYLCFEVLELFIELVWSYLFSYYILRLKIICMTENDNFSIVYNLITVIKFQQIVFRKRYLKKKT